MADSFLGRWSQRKQTERAGKTLDEPASKPTSVVIDASATSNTARSVRTELDESFGDVNQLMQDRSASGDALNHPAKAAPLSLDDVKNLTAQSDFAPFVARDVAPEIRNSAMKKLFTDPRYNVMDGLDIYIDDYSKPDPLPESMLRQMVSAKFLKLFEDEEKDPSGSGVRDDANTLVVHSVAQSEQPPLTGADSITENTPQVLGTNDDNTDLRLQQNHAAGLQGPGCSTE